MAQSSTARAATNILLLDTNILVIYSRMGEPSRRLEEKLGLQAGRIDGMVSIVSVGEAMSFARKRQWGAERQRELRALIQARLVPVDINRPEILEAYAEVDHYCERECKPAHPMGQNDMWIAATARVLNCVLVTTDRDFDVLHGKMIQRTWIDPVSLVTRSQ